MICEHALLRLAQVCFNEAMGIGTITEFQSKAASFRIVASRAIKHPAVWRLIDLAHQTNEHLPSDPYVWANKYPKVLKAVILRFINYHRNYRKHPQRLYGKLVFAHLIADLYGGIKFMFYECSASQVRSHYLANDWKIPPQHICPIESSGYLSADHIPTIHICGAGFEIYYESIELQESVLFTPRGLGLITDSPPLLNDDSEEEMMLRVSCVEIDGDATNTPVGVLELVAKDVYCLHVEHVMEAQNPNQRIFYQIYPESPNRTYFDAYKQGENLWVFCLGEHGTFRYASMSDSYDQYPYFQMFHTDASVYVTFATSQEKALSKCQNTTII